MPKEASATEQSKHGRSADIATSKNAGVNSVMRENIVQSEAEFNELARKCKSKGSYDDSDVPTSV